MTDWNLVKPVDIGGSAMRPTATGWMDCNSYWDIPPTAKGWTTEISRQLAIIESLLGDYPDVPRVLQHLEWVNGHLLNAIRVLKRINND